jgi:uncharacterized MAPEG superfamily protein
MSPELYWLALATTLSVLMWIPYGIDRIAVLGWWGHFENPRADDRPQSDWAQRQKRAHLNALEGLVTFATLVFILQFMNISTRTTALACAVYFWARLAHYVIYTLGIPVLRTASWSLCFLAQIVLILAIFRVI